jgi:putative membrane protein
MRARLILAAAVGLALVTAIVAGIGLKVVGGAIEALGWGGFALFCLSTAPMMILLGGAWLAVAQGVQTRRLQLLVWARMVRDAAAEVLPFSQIGGIAIGARAVVSAGVPEDLAVASTLADVILEVVGQFFYTLIGLAVLVVRLHAVLAAPILWPAIAGLGLLFVVAAGFMLGYRRAWAWVARQVRRRLPDSLGRVEAAGAALDAIFQNRGRLATGAALHLAAWIASAVSAWLALRLMGVDVDLSTVIALESLMYALRNLGFALPGGLGVQEGAYVILGPLFGIPPANVLALSLIKRGRDIALGVPVLLFWQAREGRGFIRARRERARRSVGT